MSARPRLLDLFCGAQGAGHGYWLAGFNVTGVDITAHPDAPHPVIVADALATLDDSGLLESFDAIHASPPCQAYTTMSNRWRGNGGAADSHLELITEVRAKLLKWGGPYVIENVPGARRDLIDPFILRGGMFGLGVDRPRLFETNFPVGPLPPTTKVANPIGVYGKLDGRRLYTRRDGTIQRAARSLDEGRRAMGVCWMQWPDLTESIPPAYTEFIGSQLADHLAIERAA
jgi:DNA (cytosine-5)-methyltransferase 1